MGQSCSSIDTQDSFSAEVFSEGGLCVSVKLLGAIVKDNALFYFFVNTGWGRKWCPWYTGVSCLQEDTNKDEEEWMEQKIPEFKY